MADAWKVGVSIVANTAGIDAALSALGLKMLGLQGKADELGGRFGRMTTMMLGLGTAGVAAGVSMLKVYYDIAKAGDKIVQQQATMRLAGIDGGTVDAVTDMASKLATQIANTTTSGNIETWAKLRPTLGDSEASAALPGTEKILASLGVKYPDIANQASAMFKALDIFGAGMNKATGKFDAATWNTSLDALGRLMVATHGMLNPTTLLQIAKGGGIMAQGADFPSFLEQMAAAFMEQGSRAGTGLMTMMGEFVGGKVTKRTAEALIGYGLVNPKGITSDHGQYSIAHPERDLVGGSDILTKGLGYWMSHDVMPMLAKHGVNVNNTEQVIQALTKFVGDQRSARTLYTLATPAGRQQSERDAAQLHQARTDGALWKVLTDGTLEGALNSVGAAWEDMVEKLGYSSGATKDVTNLVDQLGAAMRKLNLAIVNNPDEVNLWVTRFGELGTALVTFGGITVVSAIARMVGPRGGLALLGGGIIALGTATDSSRLEKFGAVLTALAAFGAAIAVPIAIGAALWDKPSFLPKFLDETPVQLAGDITKAVHTAGVALTKDLTSGFALAGKLETDVIAKAAADLLNVQHWEAAASAAGAKLGAALITAVEAAIGKLEHDLNPLNWVHASNYTPPPSQGQPIAITTNTMLDGKVISKSVTNHMTRVLAAPATGPSGFNPLAGLPSSGMSVNQ